jgi:hypothetical protein
MLLSDARVFRSNSEEFLGRCVLTGGLEMD